MAVSVRDAAGNVDIDSSGVAVYPPPPSPQTPQSFPWIELFALWIIVGLSAFVALAVSDSTLYKKRQVRELFQFMGIRQPLPYPASLFPVFRESLDSGSFQKLVEETRKQTLAWMSNARLRWQDWTRRWGDSIFWLTTTLITVVARLLIVVSTIFFLTNVPRWLQPVSRLTFSQMVFQWGESIRYFFSGTWLSTEIPFKIVSLPFPPYWQINSLPIWAYIASTLELMFVALLLSVVIAYPLGLLSGWHRGGMIDLSTRTYSMVGLFFPVMAIALLVISGAYLWWIHVFGWDSTIYGIMPQTAQWYDDYMGGVPHWVNTYGTTLPTGFPIVDTIFHGAWFLLGIVLIKTLVQALVIALTYSAVYLRYLRASVTDIVNASYIRAARSRNVTEHNLLWKHASRRALPLFIASFSATFTAFIVTVAMVELIFDDVGLGRGIFLIIGSGDLALYPSLVSIVYVFAIMVILTNVLSDGLVRVLDRRSASTSPGKV